MLFEDFIKYTPKILNVSLPAMDAHEKMAPADRKDILRAMNYEYKNPKIAAVMMLFYPKKEVTHLALIVRNSYKGVHSSQIAFPGGKFETTDRDFQETALRETHEEIGVHPTKIEVLRAFTEIYIPPSNFLVHPFLGTSNHELEFKLQEEEVAGIIELPLSEFMDDAIVSVEVMNTSYGQNINVPCFRVNNHNVWGATAMMLSELKETLKMVL